MSQMTKAAQRSIAMSAARSKLREQGIDPLAVDVEDALEVLDDLSRLDAELVASIWYMGASDNQVVLFKREWRKWRADWLLHNRLVRRANKCLDEVPTDFEGVKASLNAIDALLAK
jgi:hypothetical protein